MFILSNDDQSVIIIIQALPEPLRTALASLYVACHRHHILLRVVDKKDVVPTWMSYKDKNVKGAYVTLVPQAILDGNDPDWELFNPLWQWVGAIAERLGFNWGGEWTDVNNGAGNPSYFGFDPQKKQEIDVRKIKHEWFQPFTGVTFSDGMN